MKVELADSVWSSLSYEEKNKVLLFRQIEILEMFLERSAISQEQHDKSLHDLIVKTGHETAVEK